MCNNLRDGSGRKARPVPVSIPDLSPISYVPFAIASDSRASQTVQSWSKKAEIV